jgi:hypothetical protein
MGKHFSSRHVFQDHVQIGIVLKENWRQKINKNFGSHNPGNRNVTTKEKWINRNKI